MIRLATTADIPRMLEMMTNFVSAVDTPASKRYYDPEKYRNTLYWFVYNQLALFHPNGMFLGTVVPNLMDMTETCLHEHVWWVEQSARKTSLGRQLLAAAAEYAKSHGCAFLIAGSCAGHREDEMNDLYLKNGFFKVETNFAKDLRKKA